MTSEKPVAIFLYDFSGIMAQPWLDAGYECYIVDIQHKLGTYRHDRCPNLFTVGADIRNGWAPEQSVAKRTKFLAAFPECTNVAVSGAAHFIKKGPRALALSLDLFATCKELGEKLGVPYMIENPVSTFSTYCGKPQHTFHPYEYGGYLPEDDVHPLYPKYIAPRDAYPKKTCIWSGNSFIMPPKKPVPCPEGYSKQHTALGGKGLKTKNIRSATPRGFAKAVFEANHKR